MTDECIHGLDVQACDVCRPRERPVAPEAPVASAPPRAPRAASPRRPSPARRAPSLRGPAPDGPTGTTASVPVLTALRGHHVTHVRNLESILADGALRADATPELDVSSAPTRLRRAEATVGGRPVTDHVPFALSPLSSTWLQLRSGAADGRWSAAARATRATDFVVFVVPVTALGDELAVTDRDAGDPAARSAVGVHDGGALVRRASLTDPELLEAELLVPGRVDLSAVTLIGVGNDTVRDQVKQALVDAGGPRPRVAVYPPWFRSTDA